MVLIAVKALFMPLARLDIPAVAAKATSAMIRTYSIKPWPASSLCRRTSEARIRFVIRISCFSFKGYFLAQGDAIGYRTRYLWHVGGQTRRLNSVDGKIYDLIEN